MVCTLYSFSRRGLHHPRTTAITLIAQLPPVVFSQRACVCVCERKRESVSLWRDVYVIGYCVFVTGVARTHNETGLPRDDDGYRYGIGWQPLLYTRVVRNCVFVLVFFLLPALFSKFHNPLTGIHIQHVMRPDSHRSYDYYAVFVRRTPLRTHPRRDKPPPTIHCIAYESPTIIIIMINTRDNCRVYRIQVRSWMVVRRREIREFSRKRGRAQWSGLVDAETHVL